MTVSPPPGVSDNAAVPPLATESRSTIAQAEAGPAAVAGREPAQCALLLLLGLARPAAARPGAA